MAHVVCRTTNSGDLVPCNERDKILICHTGAPEAIIIRCRVFSYATCLSFININKTTYDNRIVTYYEL